MYPQASWVMITLAFSIATLEVASEEYNVQRRDDLRCKMFCQLVLQCEFCTGRRPVRFGKRSRQIQLEVLTSRNDVLMNDSRNNGFSFEPSQYVPRLNSQSNVRQKFPLEIIE
ncbi:unnamed protein product [Bemisia tabaci]|uniref:Uncharacterized protein n=1 Tax=Bemisia tabaci TaxID=7038 RepID=A0A9P0EYN9_BEMTA|nr:unnamed protein product [Bemisia tabaci]